jgi:hypothetical protein
MAKDIAQSIINKIKEKDGNVLLVLLILETSSKKISPDGKT